MQNITPFFWFDDEAEEAARFYVSLFKSVFGRARLGNISRYGKESSAASGRPEGSALVVEFELDGMHFNALNGGKPGNFDTRFTGAISFVINCKTQSEIDAIWNGLISDGGKPGQCGWLTDRFGVAWQVVPDSLSKYIGGKDEEAAGRAMAAMLKMTKIDIDALKAAYDGK